MNPIIGIFFDVIILVALGVTIYHCLRLSKQFNQMQANRKAFETLIQSLNVAAAKSEGVISALKQVVTGSSEELQDKINRARALSEEMEIMIQAGDNLANRLMGLAEKGRKANPAENAIIEEAPADAGSQPKTRAEKELLEAIRAKQQ